MLYGISLNADGTTKVVAQRLETQRRAGRPRRPPATARSSTCRSANPSASLRRVDPAIVVAIGVLLVVIVVGRSCWRGAAAAPRRPARRRRQPPSPAPRGASGGGFRGEGLGAKVRGLFAGAAPADAWRELEGLLLRADVGPAAAADLVARVRARPSRRRRRRASCCAGRSSPVLGPDEPLRPDRGPARGDPGRRREREREDHDDRQARRARSPRTAGRSPSPAPTRSERPPANSSRSGRSGPARTSCARTAARTRRRWRTTR